VDYYRNRQISDPLNEGMHPTEDLLDVDLAERIAPAVREFVGQLPEPYREALVLTEYEGLSQQELAERAGISLPGAKSRVQRARAMLKKLLQQCCHFEFDRYGTLMDYHEISCSCCKDQASGA
jgi:RNA polymerase sigma-70 factor (ECF subfamily)